ncbi:MAG: UTP--glucose-1-phosphate uridylyltransferase [Pseudomonadota bacterium]
MSRAFKPVRKAVLPVAGLGTRFLPATKSVPKEMLTVVDRPVVQHVAEEAFAAGIEHIVFVTGRGKGVIEDHFDHQVELEKTLHDRGKTSALDALLRDLPKAGATSFTRQQAPLGLGHAVWCARDIIGDEPFALLLPDMLHKPAQSTDGTQARNCLQDMMAAYEEHGGNHIAVAPVPEAETQKYGIVGVKDRAAKVSEITAMVEKPAPADAPSNLHITGRYILQPDIFPILAGQAKGAGNEIQLTDSMLTLSQRSDQDFFAVQFAGEIHDCGSKIGFLTANIAYGLDDADISAELKAELAKVVANTAA